MQTEQKRHEAFSVLLVKRKRWGQGAGAFIAVAAVLWTVTFLVNLDVIQGLGMMKSVNTWLDEHGLVRALLALLRYGALAGALGTAGMYIKYTYCWLARKNITGEAARLDNAVADEAMLRLEALQNAAGRGSFLDAMDEDVRVQVLAPAADCDRKDYLVHWDDDGKHEIDLGGGRFMCLRQDSYGDPCIMGQANDGTDAAPQWHEYLYPLKPHVRRVIFRGDGTERKIRYAITRIGGGKG